MADQEKHDHADAHIDRPSGRRISVRKLARFVSHHPNWCLAAAFVFTVLSLWRLPYLDIEMDVAALLPDDSEVVQISKAAQQDIGDERSFDFMLAVVEYTGEGDPPQGLLRDAADRLDFALGYPVFVQSVVYRIEPEQLELDNPEGKARAIALLTEDDWQALEQKLESDQIDMSMQRLRSLLIALPQSRVRNVLRDPLNFYEILRERVRIKSGPLKVNLRDEYFVSEDGKMLLMLVWPTRPATDLAFAQDFRTFLNETLEGLYERNEEWGAPGERLNISFYGPHYEAIADSQLVRGDLYRTSVISFVCVILVFLVAFRRLESLLFVAVPLIAGVIWTLGLASLTVGRLTQVTIALTAILIGIGIDFSVHLYNRYLEEIGRGVSNQEAVRLAVVETGPGIIAGALTTIVAFSAMLVTRFEGFRELGVTASIGILCCLLSVILILPAMLAYLGRGPVGVFSQRALPGLGLRRIYFTALAYPRVTVLIALIVSGWLGLHAVNVEFEDDFRFLKQPSEEYEELRARLGEHFEVPGNQLIAVVTGDSAQHALEQNDLLFRNIVAAETVYELIAKDSLRYFVPSQTTQRRSLERLASRNLQQDRLNLERAAERYRLSPRVFEEFMADLTAYQEAAAEAIRAEGMPIDLQPGDPEKRNALHSLASRYAKKQPDGRFRIYTQIYPPPTPQWQGEVPEPFVDQIGAGLDYPLEITGTSIIQQELKRVMLRDLAKTVLVVLVAVILVLVIYFRRNLLKVALAMTPVLLAMLCLLGIVDLMNMNIHYVNIIAFPIIIGIGVDSAIHLLQRFYEGERRDLRPAVLRTGRAIVITGLTTIFGFGALGFARFDGLRDLGVLTIIGVGTTLLMSVLVLPAIIRLVDQKLTGSGGGGDDLG